MHKYKILTDSFLFILVGWSDGEATVTARCHRSMKKNESPHSIRMIIPATVENWNGTCTCVAGAGGFCHHAVGLLFYLAHLSMSGNTVLPDEIASTSVPQRWGVPRPKKITSANVQDIKVKKIAPMMDYSKCIKSTLYSPCATYPILSEENISDMMELKPMPQIISVLNTRSVAIPTNFGNVPLGSVISYQCGLPREIIVTDMNAPDFPAVPLPCSESRIENNFCGALLEDQQSKLMSYRLSWSQAQHTEMMTRTQSENSLWYKLRECRITASKFSLVARRKSGFESLAAQLHKGSNNCTAAMQRGLDMEPAAAAAYIENSGHGVNVLQAGLIINPKCPWLAASPDRRVYNAEHEHPFGLLEIKVPKEGSELCNLPYLIRNESTNTYSLKTLHAYYYQIQCQLALSGLMWCDFFVFISPGVFHTEHIVFNYQFFKEAKDNIDQFYFNYFL